MQIMIKKGKLRQELKLMSKIKICVKNRFFCLKKKFSSKIKIVVKKAKFL